jgi:hypothetical protein
VLDRKATSERGAPVLKPASAAAEMDFLVPSTAAYKAMLKRVPDLHVRTWTRNWKPFLEVLVDVATGKNPAQTRRFATSFRDDVNKI